MPRDATRSQPYDYEVIHRTWDLATDRIEEFGSSLHGSTGLNHRILGPLKLVYYNLGARVFNSRTALLALVSGILAGSAVLYAGPEHIPLRPWQAGPATLFPIYWAALTAYLLTIPLVALLLTLARQYH
jgi:hypothetical protein